MNRLPCVRVLPAVALLVGIAAGAAEPEEHPLRNARVGEYVTYRITQVTGDLKSGATVKVVVVARDAAIVTLKEIATIDATGGLPPSTSAEERKVDLTKPYPPPFLPGGALVKDQKVERVRSGKEKVKAGGKDYDTEWEEYRVTMKVDGSDQTMSVKVWRSKAVPLDGMVKMGLRNGSLETVMELVEAGKEK